MDKTTSSRRKEARGQERPRHRPRKGGEDTTPTSQARLDYEDEPASRKIPGKQAASPQAAPAPNLRQTVPKGDAASVRVVCSTPESSEETRASLSPRFPPCATEPPDESYVAPSVEFSMCDISATLHCLAERGSKIGQTVTGKFANATRVSISIAAATARPTFRFISFETRSPNLRQTVPKGDAVSVRVVRSTPGKQRRNALFAVASVSTVRD
ncbi:hypothetical protein HPB50_011370 [Hyalomma asiaticum]|uniref:Uncharacterized protein n=1 Tax=Hyalomma asiaticum TaxID=266040 RepID=A0ACB7RRM5_HYAAI|nr:hypothetical protein HPB50_011370 [Hyalomma asiaticum]